MLAIFQLNLLLRISLSLRNNYYVLAISITNFIYFFCNLLFLRTRFTYVYLLVFLSHVLTTSYAASSFLNQIKRLYWIILTEIKFFIHIKLLFHDFSWAWHETFIAVAIKKRQNNYKLLSHRPRTSPSLRWHKLLCSMKMNWG